jgi:hypothetical protein
METPKTIESIKTFEPFHLSQMKAGEYTAIQVADAIDRNADLKELFPPIDIISAGRTICGITAVSLAVNVVSRERIIGDAGDEGFKVGDFYRFVLDYQGYKSASPHVGLENGWWVINPTTKDIYHHALIAWIENFDVEAMQVYDFKGIEDFEGFLTKGGVATVSVSNRFVKEITTENDPSCFVEEEGKTFMLIENEDNSITKREFRQNSHLVSIVGITPQKEVLFMDSFELRQQKNKNRVRRIPVLVFNQYLNKGKEKALLLSKNKIPKSDKYKILPCYIPEEVRELMREKIQNSKL